MYFHFRVKNNLSPYVLFLWVDLDMSGPMQVGVEICHPAVGSSNLIYLSVWETWKEDTGSVYNGANVFII